MSAKPLSVRLLEQKRIAHQVFEFDYAIRDAGEVAAALGFPPELVYKTLVIEHDPPKGKPFIVMVPSDSEVDLKVLAKGVGAKKLRMAGHRDAERLTGLQVGGIGALALLGRGFTTLIDERVLAQDRILVSAGQRGFDIGIGVADLIRLTGSRSVRTTAPGVVASDNRD
jgi:Cys-tRNA(Pro)/Cys-tRNA(Cys) deacylase